MNKENLDEHNQQAILDELCLPKGIDEGKGEDMTGANSGSDKPVIVHLGVMGNGVKKQCVKVGSTIEELLEQAEVEPDSSATIRLNGTVTNSNAKISSDNSVVTITSAVNGG